MEASHWLAIAPLCTETGARSFQCDAQDEAQVQRLFLDIERDHGAPDVVIYNASARTRGPFVQLVPTEVQRALQVTAFGAFLVAQQAAARMLPKGHGAILFTGASASVKGYAQSAPFAMGKFALRGLAQSLTRELSPQGIHVAHFVIDGGIRSAGRGDDPDKPDALLDPDAIALTYLGHRDLGQRFWWWAAQNTAGVLADEAARFPSDSSDFGPPPDEARLPAPVPYDTSMSADVTMARLGATARPIGAQLGALKAELEQGAPAPLT